MSNNNHVYTVEMDLETSTKTKVALSQLRDSLGESNENIDEMLKAYKELNEQVDDHDALEKEVNKIFNKRIALQDKEIDQLLKELSTKKDLTDEEKKARQDRIKALSDEKKKLKLQATEFKQARMQEKVEKSRRGIKDEMLKGLKEQIKQTKLLQVLTDKELKTRTKIAKLVASGAGKVAKVGAAVGGAVLGGAAAIGGAALASMDNITNKADALKSLKSGIDPELVDRLYVKTGADYSTIIAAINRVAGISGGKNVAGLAEAEIKNPGAGLMMAAQTKVNADIDYANVFDQIRKQTGIQDTAALADAVNNSRAVKNGWVSQKDFMLAYAQLSQAGLGDEDITRIINNVARKEGNFIDNFNSTDLSKLVYGKVNKNILKNQDLKLEGISDAPVQESDAAKKARELQEKLREFNLKKDEMLMQVFEAIAPHAQELMDLALKGMKFIADKLPSILDFVEKALKKLAEIPDDVEDAADTAVSVQKMIPVLSNLASAGEAIGAALAGDSGGALSSAVNALNPLAAVKGIYDYAHKAQGGLVTSPSLCGESGPELVLPLNNPGRAQSIINNYTNTNNFSMQGPQTALGLSQAISNNKFIRHASTF